MADHCCRLGSGDIGLPAQEAGELRQELETKMRRLKAIDDYVQAQMSRQASVLRSGAWL